jgi:hypothetical protein
MPARKKTSRMTGKDDILISTQDDLPGSDWDAICTLFVNQTEYGNAHCLRTSVLSALKDFKKYTELRFVGGQMPRR